MKRANNDGIQIHYEVTGDGPPLVLHHGFSDDVRGWYEYGYVDALAPHYQLILIDGRGHGHSDKPHSASAYSQKARTYDVLAVLDALQIDTAFYFGYSLGGWIGFGLATYAPERVRAYVLGGIQPYGQRFDKFRQVLSKGTDAWAAMMGKLAPAFRPQQLQRFRDNDARALMAALVDRPDISYILPTIRQPCLLYAGTSDPIYPSVRRAAAQLPNAEFFSLPNLNHIQTNLQGKTIAARVARFLSVAALETDLSPLSSTAPQTDRAGALIKRS